MLDPTGQRIVGVLLEKELSVPDSYPMTENAMLAACNQKSNRDPHMELEEFQLRGALMALQEQEWIARVEGGGRVPRYKHRVEQHLGLGAGERAVMAELLLRGPQAPGALKPRVARMGLDADADRIRDILHSLAERSPPLVEQLARQPRERDARWAHRLGERAAAAEAPPSSARPGQQGEPPDVERAPPAPAPAGGLESRVAALERAVEQLRAEVRSLRSAPGIEQD